MSKVEARKKVFTEEDALEYVFSHTNGVGSKIVGVNYTHFGVYRNQYKNGTLGERVRDRLFKKFGFKTKYYL